MFELTSEAVPNAVAPSGGRIKYEEVPTSEPQGCFNDNYQSKKNDNELETPSSISDNLNLPPQKFCEYCERHVYTTESSQSTVWTFVAIALSFLCCGWIAFCLTPFLWPILQTNVYRCPHCDEILQKRSRISCFTFKEKIVTIRIGSCAMVLSRTYVIACCAMGLLIALALSARWYINVVGLPDIGKGPSIDATWLDFLNDCGTRSYLGNPLKAEATFAEKYNDKTVTWVGRMHHVNEGFFSKHFMYIDMDPPQYSRDDLRDISLFFGKSMLKKIAILDTGDEVEFSATLIDLGKRGRPHLGVLWDFNRTRKSSELPSYFKGAKSPFLLIQEQIGAPIIFPQLVKRLQDVHKALLTPDNEDSDYQNHSSSHLLMFPMAELNEPINVIIEDASEAEHGLDSK